MDNSRKIYISILLTAISACLVFSDRQSLADQSFAMSQKGRILLQVEQNGEAYYIYPNDYKKYYLGRPRDAFNIMRSLSIGITDDDLKKIPVAEMNFEGGDKDNDGLSDAIEASFGTDANNSDSDKDGYSDKEEIINGYDPLGDSPLEFDGSIISRLAGSILLQVEKNGEAWYLNPNDNKRYFLSRPAEAFEVLRATGIGATNENLAKIEAYQIPEENKFVEIIQDFVVPSQNFSKNTYTDKLSGFSLEYPRSWKSKKFSGGIVQFTNTAKDFVVENAAIITAVKISPKENRDIADFRIAAIDGSTTLTDEEKTINDFPAYENSFKHLIAKEITTTIKLDENDYLKINLATTDSGYSKYLPVYNDILESVKKID